MEECIFGHAKLDMNNIEEGEWTERQYDQLKNQIIAYKYLIQNKTVPSEKFKGGIKKNLKIKILQ